MPRLWSCGFELNSLDTEVSTQTNGAISSTVSHAGTYSLRITGLASANARGICHGYTGSNSAHYYTRFYFRVDTLPTAANRIFHYCQSASLSTPSTIAASLSLNSDGTLRLVGPGGNIGSPSAALSTTAWYMIEVKARRLNGAGGDTVEARLNGVVFASTNTESITTVSFNNISLGGNLNAEAQTQGDWYFDDVAVNVNNNSRDTTFQDSYPGAGQLLYLRPAGAGDSTQWTPDTGSNFARVNEVSPDDAASFVQSGTLNQLDLYTCGPSGLTASDGIRIVQVGMRFRNNVSDITTAFKLVLKNRSGGSQTLSSNQLSGTTAWGTHTSSPGQQPYPFTQLFDPDGLYWTQQTLDTMQVGLLLSVANVNAIQVSALWVVVEYTPGQPLLNGTLINNFQSLDVGNGMSVTEKIR